MRTHDFKKHIHISTHVSTNQHSLISDYNDLGICLVMRCANFKGTGHGWIKLVVLFNPFRCTLFWNNDAGRRHPNQSAEKVMIVKVPNLQ